MEIRALRKGDDRAAFSSGDDALDLFFRRYAGQNQFRHHLGVTYVAVDGDRILGFATVAPRHVEIDGLPEQSRKKLPRYPIPVLGLVRLAVDTTARRRGLGAALLRFVLGLALEMAGTVGCAGVVVDAKPEAEPFYARYGFMSFDALEGQRPPSTLMWLSIAAVQRGGSRT